MPTAPIPSAANIPQGSAPRLRRAPGARPIARSASLDAVSSSLLAERAHPVVLRLVLDLGEPERLEHRRHVHREPPAQPLLEPVPALDRIALGAAPRLDRAVGCRLLLV